MPGIAKEWSSALDVLAHELRSPVAVISGYTRMLGQGRLGEADRVRTLDKIAQAAGTVHLLSQRAAELAHWLGPDGTGSGRLESIPLSVLIERAIRRSAEPDRASATFEEGSRDAGIGCRDGDALPAAIGALIDAVGREAPGDRIVLRARASTTAGAHDVLVGARPPGSGLDRVPPASETEPLTGFRGLGMPVAVGAAVLDAHGARLWSIGGRRGILGVSFFTAR